MSRGSRVGYGREIGPPAQRSNNRPLMWNCCRQLKDHQGQLWRSFDLFGVIAPSGSTTRFADCGS
jgi:hypothetical protein